MHIIDMKLAGLTTCPKTGRLNAKVMLLTDEGGMSIAASTTPPQTNDRQAILERLMQDALRQIQTFPEVRAGLKVVTVAEDALDREVQQG